MADLTLKLILYRVNETLSHLAELVEGFLCSPDGSPDVLSMFFIAWILLGILVYFLGTFIARYFRRPKLPPPIPSATEPASEKVIVASEVPNTHKVSASGGGGPSPRPKGSRRAVASSDDDDVIAPVALSFAGRALPVADGPDSHTTKWANQVLEYLFSEKGAKNPNLLESWLLALNQQTLKAAPQHGLLVEVNSLVVSDLNLREVLVSPESGNNVTVHCRGTSDLMTFQLTATRNTGQARATQDYETLVENLIGKLKILCNTEDSLLVVRFLDKPEARISLKASGSPQNWALPGQQSVEELIREILLQGLTSAIVDLPFEREPAFPKYIKPKPQPPPAKPQHAVASSQVVGDHHHPAQPVPLAAQHQQRLLVKLNKADNLAQGKPCTDVYCVVEMDDPSQRFQTACQQNTNSPFWGEHFLFNLKGSSAELLFEIYDRGKANQFLGLGIVSVDELQRNPSQRQVLQLRPRPTHPKEIVTGSLTAEFLFMEGSDVPSKGLVEKNSRLTKTGALITTTTIQKPEDVACLEKSVDGPDGRSSPPAIALTDQDGPHCTPPVLDQDGPDGRWTPPLIPLPDHSQFLLPKTLHRDISMSSLDATSSDSELIGPTDDYHQETTDGRPKRFSCCDSDNRDSISSNDEFATSDETAFGKVASDVFAVPSNVSIRPIDKNEPSTHIQVPDGVKDFGSQELFDILMAPFVVEPVETASPETQAAFLGPNGHSQHPSVPFEAFPNGDKPIDDISEISLSQLDGRPSPQLCSLPLDEPSLQDDIEDAVTLAKTKPVKATKLSKGLSWFKSRKQKKDAKKDDTSSVPNDSLADTALQELGRNAGTGKQTSKSTLIIHSVQRELVRPTIQVKVDRDGKWHEVSQTNGESQTGPGNAGPSLGEHGPEQISLNDTMTSDGDDPARARNKARKSSLMGALRKRLSFKKNRSKSMDQRSQGERAGVVDGQDDISGRSISADRSSRNKETPSVVDRLSVAGTRLDAGSTRSSLSEGSGFSGASSRTYINENSTLVIELKENGLMKHYLIPYSLAARSKWRKRGGLKLHIYNDHTFVAKHIPGSEQCLVCKRKFSRRPGKQGYGCRDCGLQCHKTCHVKVESHCPNSTIQNLEMEYVQDPRAKPKALPS